MSRVAYLADGEKAGLDTDGGRWQVICRYHGSILSIETRAQAQREVNAANQASTCAEWCEDCRDEDEAQS